MPQDDERRGGAFSRETLGVWVVVLGFLAIAVLAGMAMGQSTKPIDILHVVLPVFASWVGTVLAFFFGRENFESANRQVRELVQRLTPEERAQAPVKSIMRGVESVTCLKYASGKTAKDVTVADLRHQLGSSSRLPVLDASGSPQLMVHGSSLDRYKAGGGADTDTLGAFLKNEKSAGRDYGAGHGFVLVSQATTVHEAKQAMEAARGCQDIFVTATGAAKEPLVGWVSNVRLAKYLQN